MYILYDMSVYLYPSPNCMFISIDWICIFKVNSLVHYFISLVITTAAAWSDRLNYYGHQNELLTTKDFHAISLT